MKQTRFERRSDVRAYSAAFDAWLKAGAKQAPPVVDGLRRSTFAELVGSQLAAEAAARATP